MSAFVRCVTYSDNVREDYNGIVSACNRPASIGPTGCGRCRVATSFSLNYATSAPSGSHGVTFLGIEPTPIRRAGASPSEQSEPLKEKKGSPIL